MPARRPVASSGKPPGYKPPTPVRLNADEKRRVFKGMVVAELESGFLRYSRREKLLNYARQMRIPEFEANLLIAEAQFYSDHIDAIHFDSPVTFTSATSPEHWSAPLRLTVALLGAVALDLVLIHWLFG